MKGQANNLTAAELKAIEEHKYYLSQQRGTEVSIEEAIDDFVQHIAEDWREREAADGTTSNSATKSRNTSTFVPWPKDGTSADLPQPRNGAKNTRTSGARNVNRSNETGSRKSW
jgi:hypothetical protein